MLVLVFPVGQNETCEPIDFCSVSDPCVHGSCSNGPTSALCACDAGWLGSICAHNEDNCAAEPCDNGATCVDQVDGYACVCVDGYSGVTCSVDIDECATASCMENTTASCVDAVNNYTCVCAEGWMGPDCAVSLSTFYLDG